jgi:HEAT repeat protein
MRSLATQPHALDKSGVDSIASTVNHAAAVVRKAALDAVTARAWTARTGQEAERMRFAQERVLLLHLRPLIQNSLKHDPEPRVRHSAVLALGNLDFDPGGDPQSRRAVGFSDETVTAFVSAFAQEKDAFVRTEILKALALTQRSAARGQAENNIDDVIRTGLVDPHPDVIAIAVMGVRNRRLSDAMNTLAELLGATQANVRMNAAQALGAFGAEARSHLPALSLALSAEGDELTRRTISGAIEAITRNSSKLSR